MGRPTAPCGWKIPSFSIGFAAAALLPAFAAAQPVPAAPARAEACLRDNAARVARADPGVESAAAFLVNYVCAAEVEAASRYERNAELLRIVAAAGGGQPVPFQLDPLTGRLIPVPPAPGAKPGKDDDGPLDGLGAVNALQTGFSVSVSPALKKLAAELILAERSRGAR